MSESEISANEMFGSIKHTHRGFRYYEFKDRNDYKCSLQKSSVATEDCIWLGLDSASPKELVFNQGWVDATDKIPEGIEFNTRMHLTRDQAKALADQLLYFVEVGELPAVPFRGSKPPHHNNSAS